MEDSNIIELYWQRDESAIKESQKKYGSYCSKIAFNILNSSEDTKECVNETWFRAWNAIPPKRPKRLSAFFGKITRNIAIDRYRKSNAKKHSGSQTALCLDELSECISESKPVEDEIILKELLNKYIEALNEKSRSIFLYRYYYFMPISEIAKTCNMSEGAVKMLLQRTRKKLKDYLESEGIGI